MPDLNGILSNTIQSEVHRDQAMGLDIFPLLTMAGELIPPYWSQARDWELARMAYRVDHVSSAFSMFVSKFASIPIKIISRDMSIKTWVREAEYLTSNLNKMSDFGRGWTNSFAPGFVWDLLTQDNGAFAEIIGDGRKDKPRKGFYGIAALDAQSCRRTSNPLYPVVYTADDGNRYKLHYTRVMYTSSMPSTRRYLYGVGFCAMSRLINTAQHLWDISTAEQEELGSRPKRRLIIGKQGISNKDLKSAFGMADMQMDNEGLKRYSKSVVIASNVAPTSANAIEIDVMDLNLAMRGQDKEMSITLAMFLIALALNIPPRWLWPATSTGATKADAMFQHVAGMGGGIGNLIQIFINMLGGDMLADALGKPIGSQYQVIFDYQDDEQDRQQAEIREFRSKYWASGLSSGIIDVRTAREQMLEAGDLTEQQFEDMELGDGRLPDGTDVLNLFYSLDPVMQQMLAIGEGDVLNTEANSREIMLPAIEDKLIEIRAILVNPSRPKEFDAAKMAYAALMALKRLYSQPTMIEQQEGLQAIERQRNADNPEADGNDSPPEPPKATPAGGDEGDDNRDSATGIGEQRAAISANGRR